MTPWTAVSLYAVFALGGVGVYFMLPKAAPRAQAGTGAALAALALLCLLIVLGINVVAPGSPHVLFYLFSAIALAAATRVITHPKPVYSAVYFVLVVVAVAAMLVLLQAEFLAIAVLMIYAGAILVTYVFVIMLAQQSGAPATDRRSREPFLAVCAGFLTMAAVAGYAVSAPVARMGASAGASVDAPGSAPAGVRPVALSDAAAPDSSDASAGQATGNTFQIGVAVMTRYVVALEISGILLLIAMVGAVALSRKRVPVEGPVDVPPVAGRAGREVPPY